MMILGLKQLLDMEGWDRDSDALTSDVFGIIAQWYARGAGRDWLPGEAMELWTGGLVRWDDVQDGCLDLPGALLRWWGGGEHPGRMWSTRSARHALGSGVRVHMSLVHRTYTYTYGIYVDKYMCVCTA